MYTRPVYRQFAAFFLTLSFVLATSLAYADPERLTQVRLAELERQQAIEQLGTGVEIHYGDHGHIYRISGDLLLTISDAMPLDQQARADLKLLRVPLGLRGDEHLVDTRVHDIAGGTTYVRYGQEIDGIPVPHASLVIRYGPGGRANSIRNDLLIDDELPRVPLV